MLPWHFYRMAHSAGSITLYHKLPAYAEARAKHLGLKRHVYCSLLLANYLHDPGGQQLRALEKGRPEKLKRLRMQLTLPDELRSSGQKTAERMDLSFSRLMECLLILDASAPDDPLVVLPVPNFKKPPCQLPSLKTLDA